MLPLLQAEEIRHSIVEYLRATFSFSDTAMEAAFDDFLLDNKDGLFKGPYIQFRLPFSKLAEDQSLDEIIKIRPPFQPYHHQFESFKRLSTRLETEPKPVILTTGTGSGKTESFLFPLLDYCYQKQSERGIKAIILYPMNALATDQARRLAEEIYNHKDKEGNFILRDKIRAGLFIGEGKDKKVSRPTRMGADHLIEDRTTIVKSPPDILLTNFKMLDFALMQSRFHNLWSENFKNPSLLKFLVLDELHTYDGAKGTDVANLIRRLKLKLSLPQNQLVPVGTSATMSGGEEGKLDLVKFFSQVFGVAVDSSAVIEEKRLYPDEFLSEEKVEKAIAPDKVELCRFIETDDYQSYINRQLDFWGYKGLSPIEVGIELKRNSLFATLIDLTGSSITKVGSLLKLWAKRTNLEETLEVDQIYLVFQSLISIISYAKEKSGSKEFPFLYLQITSWLRSLTKVVLKTQPHPKFNWEGEEKLEDKVKSLPPYFCRECGSSGWIGIKKESANQFDNDLSKTRLQFFSDKSMNKNVFFVSNIEGKNEQEIFASDYQFTGDPINGYLDPNTLVIHDRSFENRFKIFGVRRQNGNYIEKVCPHCNSRNTLALIGTGLTTLESISAAQILATPTDQSSDKYRKLLAFTNSVQDAAHQAGFIESRNYRFGMRHAIQGTLNTLDATIPLTKFYEVFEQNWKTSIDAEPSEKLDSYYNKFLPPDCESRLKLEDFQNKGGGYKSAFEKEFSNRMAWEIWSEYSYNAAIGRTLEKSGASGVVFNPELMEEVYEQLHFWLKENTLGERVSKGKFLKFLVGFLHRVRLRGGVNHNYLKNFRTSNSSYWKITQNANKNHFLIRNFGKRTRLPRFITLQGGKNTSVFDVVKTNNTQNWFSTFFLKSFFVGKEELDLINDFYEKLVEYLDANRLLDKKVASGIINYGISPEQIFITNEVSGLECNKCGNLLHVGDANLAIAKEMPCLQYRCSGHYRELDTERFDYYRMVYNRGKSLRIFAKDHTGLIERNKREELERQFKTRPDYKSPNVLVATSTLEMGIDIGDLNVTFNSSLPPETSNYLQRVGRAGRSSGTSLILNIAGRDKHDLHFFQEPMNMMDGDVRTPACYLQAKDILKRHFMAYCLDSWATQDPEGHLIPRQIKLLKIEELPIGDKRFVFNQVSDFIESSGTKLFDRFVEQYQLNNTDDEPIPMDDLERELNSGQFIRRLTQTHQALKSEIEFYEQKAKEVDKQLSKLPSTGNETDLLKKEKKTLQAAKRAIRNRNTIEHLTNIGVLPNYAFPETGVSLNAQVTRKKEVEGKIEYIDESFPIVRPSSTALTELAPENIFYTQGYKMEVQGLEVLSRDDFEEYRFCSGCNNFAKEVDIKKGEELCPICSHASWGSISNKKTLVRMRSVMSVNDIDKSKITDSSEERDRKFYQRSIHIQAEPESSKGAYVLKSVPFGIEFFTKTLYTGINTGLREDGIQGRTIEIDSKKHSETGFIICKKCGKVTAKSISEKELNNRRKSYHFGYCSNKEINYDPKGVNEHFEEIYIYRNFNTEALAILLPIQDFRTEEKIAMFKAGLLLGMKGYYKGRPDHIRIEEYTAFNMHKRRKERYLIMYETIPGGTGYLSKLFNIDEFSKLLRSAYDGIRYCKCKEEGKDGCYRCLYTYGNQFERDVLSRTEAEKLFGEIVAKADEWNTVDSLRGLDGFANIEQSELEQKFIEYFKIKSEKTTGWDFKEEIEDGVKTYSLTLSKNDNQITYRILPQNLENRLSGIPFVTRPDFVLRCSFIKRGETNLTQDEIKSIKDIVVYLDGYEYHASSEHRRVPADIRIRNAIVDSEKYQLWVFTWDDLEYAKEDKHDALSSVIKSESIKSIFQKHPKYKQYTPFEVFEKNNISRFEFLLMAPILTMELKSWASLLLFCCHRSMLSSCYDEELIRNNFLKNFKVETNEVRSGDPKSFSHADDLRFSEEMELQVFVDPQSFNVSGYAKFNDSLEKWEKDNWQFFWHVYNLTQFFEIQAVPLSKIEELKQNDSSGDIDEVLENFAPELHSAVKQLLSKKIEINTEFEFDLMSDDEILASGELGSHTSKFVVNPFDEQSKIEFQNQGYQVIEQNELSDFINQL